MPNGSARYSDGGVEIAYFFPQMSLYSRRTGIASRVVKCLQTSGFRCVRAGRPSSNRWVRSRFVAAGCCVGFTGVENATSRHGRICQVVAREAGTARGDCCPGRDQRCHGGRRHAQGLLDSGLATRSKAVFIPEVDRGTLCISTQAGCAVNWCSARTGEQGFTRNLTTAEIIGQLGWLNSVACWQ